MGHDQLFKTVLRGLLREFLELFFPDFAARLDFRSLRFPDRELFKGFPDGTRREPDVVTQVRTLDGEPQTVVVHVEVEAEARGKFPRRMFEYYALLWLGFDAPVFPIALHLTRGPRQGIAMGEYRQELFGQDVVRFRYATISLARMTAWEYVEKGARSRTRGAHAQAPRAGGSGSSGWVDATSPDEPAGGLAEVRAGQRDRNVLSAFGQSEGALPGADFERGVSKRARR